LKDPRLYKRIPCDGQGTLVVADVSLDVTAVNLSKGGVCLRMTEADWQRLSLDDLDLLAGRLTVDGDLFTFEAGICWSNTAKGSVFFGVEFKKHDKHILDAVLERLSVVDDPPPMEPFNI